MRSVPGSVPTIRQSKLPTLATINSQVLMIRDIPVNWNDDRYDDFEADLENVAVVAEACGGADELAIAVAAGCRCVCIVSIAFISTARAWPR